MGHRVQPIVLHRHHREARINQGRVCLVDHTALGDEELLLAGEAVFLELDRCESVV